MFKAVIYGDEGSGKTELVAQLNDSAAEFRENRLSTIGVELAIINETKQRDTNKIQIWDLSGQERFKSVLFPYLFKMDMAILTFDMSEDLPFESVNKIVTPLYSGLESSNSHCSSMPILIVGTRIDLASPVDLEKREQTLNAHLLTIAEQNQINVDNMIVILTSSKCKVNIDLLKQHLFRIANLKIASQNQPIDEIAALSSEEVFALPSAYTDLNDAIKKLPTMQADLMKHELDILEKKLREQDSNRDKAQAIDAFTTNCAAILNGQHSSTFNKVLKFAAAIVVALCVGMIGFGIGCLAGVWAGPVALVSGVAGAIGAASLAFGGLTAYGLFKESKASTDTNAALTDYVDNVKQECGI